MTTPQNIRDRQVGFVGRCKRCKTGHRAEVTETVRSYTTTYRTVQGYPMDRTERRYRYPGSTESGTAATTYRVTCGCGATVHLKRVRAVVNDHVCNAKCTNATGPCCECSCGGKNHGAGHASAGVL